MSWMLISKMGSIVTRVILVHFICGMVGWSIVSMNCICDGVT